MVPSGGRARRLRWRNERPRRFLAAGWWSSVTTGATSRSTRDRPLHLHRSSTPRVGISRTYSGEPASTFRRQVWRTNVFVGLRREGMTASIHLAWKESASSRRAKAYRKCNVGAPAQGLPRTRPRADPHARDWIGRRAVGAVHRVPTLDSSDAVVLRNVRIGSVSTTFDRHRASDVLALNARPPAAARHPAARPPERSGRNTRHQQPTVGDLYARRRPAPPTHTASLRDAARAPICCPVALLHIAHVGASAREEPPEGLDEALRRLELFETGCQRRAICTHLERCSRRLTRRAFERQHRPNDELHPAKPRRRRGRSSRYFKMNLIREALAKRTGTSLS